MFNTPTGPMFDFGTVSGPSNGPHSTYPADGTPVEYYACEHFSLSAPYLKSVECAICGVLEPSGGSDDGR